jgi:DNA-binding SARP family transcriptional activator
VSGAITETIQAEKPREAAAKRFVATGQWEEAIHHWLELGNIDEVVHSVIHAAPRALAEGRLATVEDWLRLIPDRRVSDEAALQVLRGNLLRLRSQFDAALHCFARASQLSETARDEAGLRQALLGQVHIYLDTVRPRQAEHLLERIIAMTNAEHSAHERAEVLLILAENKLNLGKPGEATRLLNEAQTLMGASVGDAVLRARILLRTGNMREAAHGLAELAEQESNRGHAPRGHREIPLLLSLIHAFWGNAERAVGLAQEGIALGRRLGSPFIEAVGYIRLGHALQLRAQGWRNMAGQSQNDIADAIHCYHTAVSMGDQMAVRRLRSEAMWGLARAHGLRGELAQAREAAENGLEVALAAGDIWIAGLIELALGAACSRQRVYAEAQHWLTKAQTRFEASADPLGQVASQLWQVLSAAQADKPDKHTQFHKILRWVDAHDLGFLLSTANLLGPPDVRQIVPLLISAREQAHDPVASQLLQTLGLARVKRHRGYQLRVQTLGDFRMWRGDDEVSAGEWKRTSARRLLWQLIAERHTWLPREQLIEGLWHELDPDVGQTHFKVTLNALNRVLEPDRATNDEPLFVQCSDKAYRLNPQADIWLDCAEFELACNRSDWQMARGLYQGDFLPMAAYDDTCTALRQRLLSRWLMAMDHLATAAFVRSEYDECMADCELLLARDVCWENAYRLLMRVHDRRGDVAQAMRAFQRCEAALKRELGIKPAAATMLLLRELTIG